MRNFMDYEILPIRYTNNVNSSIPIESIDNVKARWNINNTDKGKKTVKSRGLTVGQLIEALMRGMNEGYIDAHSFIKANNKNIVNIQISNDIANIII